MDDISCIHDTVEDEYSFYEHIDKYLEYEGSYNPDRNYNIYNEICASIGLNLYINFHCLIEEIIKTTSTLNNTSDMAYINYWINYELYKINANIYPISLHRNMKITDSINDTLRELDGKLACIKREELINMKELFDLYRNCIHIINATTGHVVNEEFLKHEIKQCVDKHQKIEENCPKNMAPFCKALSAFKEKYDKID
ncbi:hypothetical protein PCYB_004690 [Plasmodium cynomolgi strain B]|uniref:PIR Superfamily Protein n=1 Tax=Plasmodium cynomolgi (strain B) TaxID=1120755 RepID=K6V317_PLACD|nr:hypothetical protein PCYB_004690 [Plasmodium cynomolgi strain B]GAB69720.1 hypothetical protein PCYB_004690 [Plasmodium cynomolgi strain B]